MRLLLDTHALVWALGNPDRLSALARDLIEDIRNEVFASPLSAYEIGQKYHRGQWQDARFLALDFDTAISPPGFQIAYLTAKQASLASGFSVDHKDPFDRMLAAQAIDLGIPIVSSDDKLDLFNVNRIW